MNKILEEQVDLCVRINDIRKSFVMDKGNDEKISHKSILRALEQFTECVRYLNVRRSGGTKLNLESEADVQDAIYLMLRPWVIDLAYESPDHKVGNRFAIKDFISRGAKTIIEAKYIRDETHGKQITKELHDDIEIYRHNQDCENLIFFIYDPNSFIPDVLALSKSIAVQRTYSDSSRTIACHMVVRP